MSRLSIEIAVYPATIVGTFLILLANSSSLRLQSLKAVTMGKPYPEMYRMALRRMKLEISDTLMVGDMLSTDIKGALDLGMDAALVLTGMSKREDIEKSGVTPTFVMDSLKGLVNA